MPENYPALLTVRSGDSVVLECVSGGADRQGGLGDLGAALAQFGLQAKAGINRLHLLDQRLGGDVAHAPRHARADVGSPRPPARLRRGRSRR